MNKNVLKSLIAAVIAAAIIATVIIVITINQNKDSGKSGTQETTAAATVSTEPVTQDAQSTTKDLPDAPPATETPIATEEPETMPTIDIALPTEGGEVTYFSGVYVPDSSAEDISKGTKVSMRSLFGQSYSSGALTFNADGTFTDTLSSTGTAAGAYHVENGEITAVYLPDRQMDITVIDWDGQNNKPFSFYVIYSMGTNANYKVYFTEKK